MWHFYWWSGYPSLLFCWSLMQLPEYFCPEKLRIQFHQDDMQKFYSWRRKKYSAARYLSVPKNSPMRKHQIFFKPLGFWYIYDPELNFCALIFFLLLCYLNSAYIQDIMLLVCLYCVIEWVSPFFHQIKF